VYDPRTIIGRYKVTQNDAERITLLRLGKGKQLFETDTFKGLSFKFPADLEWNGFLSFMVLLQFQEGIFFREIIPVDLLPEGLDEILIVNHPVMQTSAWERANNLGVSNDVVDDIRRAIHKKDEKLHRLYQKQRLNYYWLLITTDRLHGVKTFNLPEKIMNHEFHSEFQHVFLFDLIKASVYQLV